MIQFHDMEYCRSLLVRLRIIAIPVGAFLEATCFTALATVMPAQMVGLNGYSTEPIFTIGETMNGYTPPGIPDGMAAYDKGDHVYLLVNHELDSTLGHPYTLANGTELVGARVSTFSINKNTREIIDADLAYDKIYNRAGMIVDEASDLEFGGLNRLCSAFGIDAGAYGFVDAVYFTGEEIEGGTEWVLDVDARELWAAPALGRGAWESVAPLSVRAINDTHIVLLIGDDRGAAPLYLYVGEKDQRAGAGFLARNGLDQGRLYMWKANDGSTQPAEFTGTGNSKKGKFIEILNYDSSRAGQPGFDNLGYADQANLDAQRDAIRAFRFSRPEDIHTNPRNGNQAIFASTGCFLDFDQDGVNDDDQDAWGTLYTIDVKLNQRALKKNEIIAHLKVLFDGDDAAGNGLRSPDYGIRSPDNLTWASDKFAYIQEDRAVDSFGSDSGEETSIWRIDPHNRKIVRVAQMNRSAVPPGQVDIAPGDLGNWESSGIIDVSDLFDFDGTLLLFNVQAHSISFGNAVDESLVQGGQLLFLARFDQNW